MEAAKLVLGFILFIFRLNLLVFAADVYSRYDFPPGFVFGASASAYQYEGAANEDGRTPSIWDTYTDTHTESLHGQNADIACDGYHKYKEDVQLVVETGLDAYRFSISWSRLIPNGRGPINPKGFQYYNNFINELVRNGIQPHVSLHHSDLPQALEDEYGGWVDRRIVRDYTAYAEICFREFGDRVSHWTTINEPNVFVLGGYDIGFMPPQRCSKCSRGNSSTEPYMATHNILLAHAAADKQHGFIGINLFGSWFIPSTNSTADRNAARRGNDFYVGWYMHPLVYGDYPSSMKKNAGSRLPAFTTLESKQVKGSFDFIGFNFYYTMSVTDRSSSLEWENRDYLADMAADCRGLETNGTIIEIPINPWSLTRFLDYLKEAYGNPPVYIHENGQVTLQNSSLEDWSRVKYLNAYIGGVLDAIRNGSDTRGYFAWSFLDLFEMFGGYDSSYGLYYVDRDDPELKRYPKLSAHWYSQLLKGKAIDSIEVIHNNDLVSLNNAKFTF